MKLEAAERCHKVELRYELVQLYVDAQHREAVGRLQRRHPIGLLHHDLKNKNRFNYSLAYYEFNL